MNKDAYSLSIDLIGSRTVNLSFNQNQSSTVTYFFRFVLLLLVLQSIVLVIHQYSLSATLVQNSIAQLVANIYNHFFVPITVEGNLLIHANTDRFLIVDNQCTGLMLTASVSAAIFAFRYPVNLKMAYVLLGIIVIQLQNVLRILHLVFESQTVDNSFDFYHLYFWQLMNFLTALFVIFLSEYLMNKKAKEKKFL